MDFLVLGEALGRGCHRDPGLTDFFPVCKAEVTACFFSFVVSFLMRHSTWKPPLSQEREIKLLS